MAKRSKSCYGVATDVKLRHTLMGLITLLRYGSINPFQHINNVLADIQQYLVTKLPEWGAR